jgi:intraflagellar transport protein 122
VIFTHDGSKLVATAGSEILIYNAMDGSLIKALKAHKDSVISLCPLLGDGFASGGADKQVVIWSNAFQGILKYSHGDTIQSISQNPVSGTVLTCTASDFGLWTPDVKAVPKTKVPSRIVCSSWTPDGQQFALGLYNGHISIRSSSGEEQVRIERGTAPIWTLNWCPKEGQETNVLAVADWSQRLSFFEATGRQVGKDRQLNYDPCSVNHFGTGDYVLMGGSNKKVQLWTCEGILVDEVCQREGWVWSCKAQPNSPYFAIGSDDGTISVQQLSFDTIDAFFGDKYAYRQSLTDVVIRNLATKQESRIKCRGYIKKIALYKDSLAVQLPERILIYDMMLDESGESHYRIRDKIQQKIDLQGFMVTSENVLYAMNNRLQMLSTSGEKQHEWSFDAPIRCSKVFGGAKGKEGLLVGLKDGHIYKIFLDNPFPILLLKHSIGIESIDINFTRKKLAIIDDEKTCVVYDVMTKQVLFQEPNCSQVIWNAELDDSAVFAAGGIISIKIDSFPTFQQKLDNVGSIVGFRGRTVYVMNGPNVSTVDIPLSIPLDGYIEKGDLDSAYGIACLGVPEQEWSRLGKVALEQLNVDVATKSFQRIKNFKYNEALRHLSKMKQEGKRDGDLILAEIAAFSGNYYDVFFVHVRQRDFSREVGMCRKLSKCTPSSIYGKQHNSL